MKNRKKIVRIKDRKNNIPKPPICPYCGRRSVLRPAEYVYGQYHISRKLFVCMQRLSGMWGLCGGS